MPLLSVPNSLSVDHSETSPSTVMVSGVVAETKPMNACKQNSRTMKLAVALIDLG